MYSPAQVHMDCGVEERRLSVVIKYLRTSMYEDEHLDLI